MFIRRHFNGKNARSQIISVKNTIVGKIGRFENNSKHIWIKSF